MAFDFTPIDENSSPEPVSNNNALLGMIQSLGKTGLGAAGHFAKGIGNVSNLAHQFLTQPQLREQLDKNFPQFRRQETTPELQKAVEQQISSLGPLGDILKQPGASYEKGVEKVFGKENMQPNNFLTKNLYDISEAAPLLSILGLKHAPTEFLSNPIEITKGALKAAGKALPVEYASSLSGKLAGEYLGPIGDIATSALTRYGFNKTATMRKRMHDIQKGNMNISDAVKTYGEKAINDVYKTTDKLGERIKLKPNYTLNSSLDKLKNKAMDQELTRNFTEKDRKRFMDNIDLWRDKVTNTDFNAKDLRNIKTRINSTYDPTKKTLSSLTKEARDLVKEELEGVATKNPNWGKNYKSADELTRLKNWDKSIINMFAEGDKLDAFKKLLGPFAKSSLGALLGGGAGAVLGIPKIGAAAGSAIQSGFQGLQKGSKELKFLRELSATPDGQKILWDIVGSGAKGIEKGVAQSLHRYNRFAKKWEEKNKTKQNRFDFTPI